MNSRNCSSCEYREASYSENWKYMGFVPKGKIYAVFCGLEAYKDREETFLNRVKYEGCPKCTARAKELEEKHAREKAAKVSFERRLFGNLYTYNGAPTS